MAILADCPICHGKQATKNKVCKCGEDGQGKAVKEGQVLDLVLSDQWETRP
jgi:hypothetical protein